MQELIPLLLFSILQAITEFLPISSTAHILILNQLTGFNDECSIIVIQLGNVIALCYFYRHIIAQTFRDIISNTLLRFTTNVIIACVPITVVGFIIRAILSINMFSIILMCAMLVLGGILMIAIEKFKAPHRTSLDEITSLDALYIGCAQIMAVVPGFSRLGATIIGARLLGFNNNIAIQFSFLISIPTTILSTFSQIYKIDFSQFNLIPTLLGTIVTLVISMLVIKTVIRFLTKYGLSFFGYYRIILGIAIYTMNKLC